MKLNSRKAASIAMALVMTASMTAPQVAGFVNFVPAAITASAAATDVSDLEIPFRSGKFYVSKDLSSKIITEKINGTDNAVPFWSKRELSVYDIDGSDGKGTNLGGFTGTQTSLMSSVNVTTSDITAAYTEGHTYAFILKGTSSVNKSEALTVLIWSRTEGWSVPVQSIYKEADLLNGSNKYVQNVVKDTLLSRVLVKANVKNLTNSSSVCTVSDGAGYFTESTSKEPVLCADGGGLVFTSSDAAHMTIQTGAGITYTIISSVSGAGAGGVSVLTDSPITIEHTVATGKFSNTYYANYLMLSDAVNTVASAVFYEDAIDNVVVYKNGTAVKTLTGAEFTSLTSFEALTNASANDVYTLRVTFADSIKSSKLYSLNTSTGIWTLNGTSGVCGAAAADSAEDAKLIADGAVSILDDDNEYIVSISHKTFPDDAAACYYYIGSTNNKQKSWTLEEYLCGEETVDLGTLTGDVKGIVFDYNKAGTAVYQFVYMNGKVAPVLVNATGQRAEESMPNDVLQQAFTNEGDNLLIVGTDVYGDPVERHIQANGSVADVPTGDVKDGYIYDEDTGLFDMIKDGHSATQANGEDAFVLNKDTGSNSAVGSNGKAGDVIAITATDKNGKDASFELTLTADNQPIPVGSAKNGIVADKTTGLFDIMVNGYPDDGDIFNLSNADGTNALVPSNGKKGDTVVIDGTDKDGSPIHREITLTEDGQALPTGDVVNGTVTDKTTGLVDVIKDGKPDSGNSFNLTDNDGTNTAVDSNGKKGDTVVIDGTDKNGNPVHKEITLTEDGQALLTGDVVNGIVTDKTTGLFDEIVDGKPDSGKSYNLTDSDGTNATVASNGKKGDTVVIDGTDKDDNSVHREITLSEDSQALPTGDVAEGTVTDKTTGIFDEIVNGKPDSGKQFNLTDNDGTNATVASNGKKGDVVSIDGTDKDGNPVHREITLTEDGQALPTGDVASGAVTDKTTGIFDGIVNGKPDSGKSYNLTTSDGSNTAVASNGKKGDAVVIEGTDADGNKIHRELTLAEDGQVLPTGDIKEGIVKDVTSGYADVIENGKPDSGKVFNLATLETYNPTYKLKDTAGNVLKEGEVVSGKDYDAVTDLKTDLGLTAAEVTMMQKSSSCGVLVLEEQPGSSNYWKDLAITATNKAALQLEIKSSKATGKVTAFALTDVEGDINQDGAFNVKDIVFAGTYLHGKQSLKPNQFVSGDISGDGKVNIFDMVYLKKLLLKK